MANHKFKAAGAPVITPTEIGDHYINTTNGDNYLSTGVATSADWVLVPDGVNLNNGILGLQVGSLGVGAGVLATGIQDYFEVPWNCTLISNRVYGNAVGSIVFDLWVDTYANYPPTVADTITASAKPTLASANKSENLTLTGWTKALSKGDIIAFNIDSATVLTWALLTLQLEKS